MRWVNRQKGYCTEKECSLCRGRYEGVGEMLVVLLIWGIQIADCLIYTSSPVWKNRSYSECALYEMMDFKRVENQLCFVHLCSLGFRFAFFPTISKYFFQHTVMNGEIVHNHSWSCLYYRMIWHFSHKLNTRFWVTLVSLLFDKVLRSKFVHSKF